MSATFTPVITAQLSPLVQARVLYADTDQLGIVYHASYFRYLEAARVELIRASGVSYSRLEKAGLALPLVELGVRFIKPALYDDTMTVYVGLSLVTTIRLNVQYRVMVQAGDREGLDEPVEILTAETRHCCVGRHDTKPARLPADAVALFQAQLAGLSTHPVRGPTDQP